MGAHPPARSPVRPSFARTRNLLLLRPDRSSGWFLWFESVRGEDISGYYRSMRIHAPDYDLDGHSIRWVEPSFETL
jgi:hypothetical protein